MMEHRSKHGPGPMPVQRPTWHLKGAAGVAPAQIAITKTESVRGGGVPTPPFHEASPLSDESPVLNGGGPIRPVEQDVLKTWRDHPAFALRTAQPKIVEAASTPPAKIWREHPAFALRAAQPRSAIVDTINQPSEIVDLAPPATRPPRGLHLPQSTSGKVATRPPFSINHSAPPKPADELTRERSISHKEKSAENVSVVCKPAPAAYRPREPTHESPCSFCVPILSNVPRPSFLTQRYRCTRPG
jgi:hypothetical protein